MSATWSFVIVYYISQWFKLGNTQFDDFWKSPWSYVQNNYVETMFLIIGTVIMIFTPLVIAIKKGRSSC